MPTLPVEQSLQCLIRGAVRSDHAAGGAVFVCHADTGTFELLAHAGLTERMIAFVRTLTPGDGTATGDAAAHRHRIIIRDVQEDYFAERRDSAQGSGIRAVVAVPLMNPGDAVEGVFSLFYTEPHHPSLDAMDQLMLYAGIALRLLRISRLQDMLERASSALLASALTSSGRQAMWSAATLLRACKCGLGVRPEFELIGHELDRVDRELSAAAKAHLATTSHLPPPRAPSLGQHLSM